ncbi:hypothetical protein MMC27_005187 [Xylographa pallens]|nr:hypothetical protein [Xylographa pallens]
MAPPADPSAAFDPLTATAVDLRAALANGHLTSVQIVTQYLAQIQTHNRSGLALRAIISPAPLALALTHARALDRERAAGKTRSPLHGIPLIVKDAIATSAATGLPTTAGAAAFEGCFARRNADVVERLLQQGVLILGKASLTELCGHKAACTTAGWGALNGQTQSAYVRGGFRAGDLFMGRSGPGGSSSGSAVGVAAGFAPLALGTETSGSVVMPANRAGLYAMTPTRGSVSLEGVFALSRDFDKLGAMAKCPADLALLMSALSGSRVEESISGGWENVSVGFVDPRVWDAFRYSDPRDESVEDQIITQYEWAMAQIQNRGGKVVYPIELPSMESLQYEGKSVTRSVAFHQIPSLMEEFCSKLIDPPVRSLAELIEWNRKNASRAMPEPHTNQADLLETLESSMTDATAAAALTHGRRLAGPQGIDRALAEHNVDFIIGPGDCAICALAALAGYPTAVVPLGILEGEGGMGQPQGLMMISGAGGEGRMLEFMRLWEGVVGGWKVPLLLRATEGK